MPRKKNEREAKECRIKEYLIGLELKALSVVLGGWSMTGVMDKRKLQAFRDAIMAGLARGKKEEVEREIVEDEYLVMCDVVDSIRETDNVEARVLHKVCLTGRRSRSFSRAFPCPPKMFKEFKFKISSGRKREVIARKLVATRLLASETTIKNVVRHMKPRRYETSPEQRLLASLFFDASSFPSSKELVAIRITLLDALLATEYPPIAIYYLVQTAHELLEPIAMTCNTAEEVKKLCKLVAPKSKLCFGCLANQ